MNSKLEAARQRAEEIFWALFRIKPKWEITAVFDNSPTCECEHQSDSYYITALINDDGTCHIYASNNNAQPDDIIVLFDRF